MLFKNTKVGLHRSQAERLQHLKSYQELRNSGDCELFDFLYENLNILDAKTAALLQFNGISLAVITILMALVSSVYTKGLLIAILVLCALSSLISLKGIYLHWASTEDFKNTAEYLEQLLLVRDERTIAYRRAWLFSVWSIVLFCFVIVINYIGSVFLHLF